MVILPNPLFYQTPGSSSTASLQRGASELGRSLEVAGDKKNKPGKPGPKVMATDLRKVRLRHITDEACNERGGKSAAERNSVRYDLGAMHSRG